MTIFMFSLAGVPPMVGFYAKLSILQALVTDQRAVATSWLAVFAVLMSLIGAFYYLRVVKVMYFDAPSRHAGARARAAASARCWRSTAPRCWCFGLLPGGLMDAVPRRDPEGAGQLSAAPADADARRQWQPDRHGRPRTCVEHVRQRRAGLFKGDFLDVRRDTVRAARRRAGDARVRRASRRGDGRAAARRRPAGDGAPVPLSGGPRDAGVSGRQARRRRDRRWPARSANWPRKPATAPASGRVPACCTTPSPIRPKSSRSGSRAA